MRSHRSWCVILSASLVALICLAAASSHAQLFPNAPSNLNTPEGMISPPVLPPQLPGALAGQVAQAIDDSNPLNAPPVRPAAFNAFSNAGGPMQATQVQPESHARLRDANSLGQQPQNPNAYAPRTGYAGQPTVHNTAMQQPVYPQGNYVPNGYANNNGQQTYLPPGHLAENPLSNSAAAQPGAIRVPVVAGDPRFVSPAPRQGRYPTVPYQAPFRTVAYQLPQQAPLAQAVQPPSQLPNQPPVVPPAASPMPQFQPTVGQLASYQALQPGYCAPTIPSNGVPAYVPGAVVPPTLPPNLTPQLYTPDNSGYRPLFSLGQENYNVQLGRGIIGQPTVYVAGQPVRNFMRYIFP